MDIARNAPAIASAGAYIAAPPQVVWAVLTDLERWPNWNGDVASIKADGPLAPGTVFRWKSGGMPIRSTIQEVEHARRIGWTGTAPLGIRAVHLWSLEPDGDGTRVRTEESFEGVLAHLFSGTMRKMLAGALERNVAALGAEATRRAG